MALVVTIIASGGASVSSVTYDGAPMAQQANQVDGSNGARVLVYTLLNPAPGIHAVLVTFSGASYYVCGSQSFSGVAGIGAVTSNTVSAFSDTGTLTTTLADSAIAGVVGAVNNQNTAFTFGNSAGWTAVWSGTTPSGSILNGEQVFASAAAAGGYSLSAGLNPSSGVSTPDTDMALVELTGAPCASPTASPTPGPCGLALDAVSGSEFGEASSITWNHSVGNGADRALVVGVVADGSASITSMDYDGVPMTQNIDLGDGSNMERVFVYTLLNPPSGANNIVVTFTGETYYVAGAQSFSNVGSVGAVDEGSLQAFSNTLGLTTDGNDSMIAGVVSAENNQNTAFTFTNASGQGVAWAGGTSSGSILNGEQFYQQAGPAGAYSATTDFNPSSGVNAPYSSMGLVELVSSCPAASPTPSGSPTPVPKATLTASPTPSGSFTPTQKASPTGTFVPTATATVTASPTRTPTPGATPLVPTATPAQYLSLTAMYPNPDPSHGKVWLPYVLTCAANVDIRVYDVAGETVRDLAPFAGQAGANEEEWDGLNSSGQAVAAGVYLGHITAQALGA